MWQRFFFTPSKQGTNSSHSQDGGTGGGAGEWKQVYLALFPRFCLKTVLVKDDQGPQLALPNQWGQHKHLWPLGQTGVS